VLLPDRKNNVFFSETFATVYISTAIFDVAALDAVTLFLGPSELKTVLRQTAGNWQLAQITQSSSVPVPRDTTKSSHDFF